MDPELLKIVSIISAAGAVGIGSIMPALAEGRAVTAAMDALAELAHAGQIRFTYSGADPCSDAADADIAIGISHDVALRSEVKHAVEHGANLTVFPEFPTARSAGFEVEAFGAGSLLIAGETLVIMRESGELALAPASPKAFRFASRAQLLPGVVRAYPALADGRYFVRNEYQLIAFDLRK